MPAAPRRCLLAAAKAQAEGELCGWNRRLHLEIRRLQDTRMYRGATSAPSGRVGSQAASTKASASGEQSPTGKFRNGATPYALVLAKRLGLRYVTSDSLSIRRARRGRGWIYIGHNQHPIRDPKIIRRLARLAVPPAYADVLYAADPDAHLQAIGRDAAGRLQYRYHTRWEDVRELRKSRRLARLADALPRIQRCISQCLASQACTREFVCAAIIDLVTRSAIRAGTETYTRLRGTRGAVTLLKSNVTVRGKVITLKFRSKGGKIVTKEVAAGRLARAIRALLRLPGRRLFQHRLEDGEVRTVTAHEVNTCLREMAGTSISLKDFRMLLASARVLEALAQVQPAPRERQRRKQVRAAVSAAADDLANTPTICRKSYVHESVVRAFEQGVLERFSTSLKYSRSPIGCASVLAKVIATMGKPSGSEGERGSARAR
jgi:DNA topoisomerase I